MRWTGSDGRRARVAVRRWLLLAGAVLGLLLLPRGYDEYRFRNRFARCVLESQEEQRQCLLDLESAAIPYSSILMEGLVRNCRLSSEYRAFSCARH